MLATDYIHPSNSKNNPQISKYYFCQNITKSNMSVSTTLKNSILGWILISHSVLVVLNHYWLNWCSKKNKKTDRGTNLSGLYPVCSVPLSSDCHLPHLPCIRSQQNKAACLIVLKWEITQRDFWPLWIAVCLCKPSNLCEPQKATQTHSIQPTHTSMCHLHTLPNK